MQLISYQDTQIALGSQCSLVLVGDFSQQSADRIFAALWLYIYKFEQRFSRFLEKSELSLINKNSGKPHYASKQMIQLCMRSLDLSQQTEGLHNPFILPALIKTGYAHNSLVMHRDDPLPEYHGTRIAKPTELRVSLSESTVTIPSDTSLDFGGIGKGYLADMLADEPAIKKLTGYWFSIGGDVAGAGTDESGNPWRVRIQNAHQKEQTLTFEITQQDTFHIATSGTIEKTGLINGKPWHHIIDPRTGKTAVSDTLLATVSARSTAEADVLATSAIILSSKKALPFLRRQGALSALMQLRDRTIMGFGDIYDQYIESRLEATRSVSQ